MHPWHIGGEYSRPGTQRQKDGSLGMAYDNPVFLWNEIRGVWVTLGTDKTRGGGEGHLVGVTGGVKDAVKGRMQPVSAVSKNGPCGDAEGKVNIPESRLGKGRCFVLTDRCRRCWGSIVINEALRKMSRMQIMIIKRKGR